MAQEISTIEAVRERMVDRVLVVLAILMVPAAVLSWSRVLLIGVQPVMYLHAAVAIVLCVAAMLRRRLSFAMKTLVMLAPFFVMGAAGLIAFGVVGLGGLLLIIFIMMTTVFLGKRQGWLALAVSGGVTSFVAVGVSMGKVQFDFDILAYALSPITWTVYVIAFVFFSAIILTVLATIQDALTDSIATLQDKAAELAAARDQAEIANRSKSAFMSNISHEFRTPLNAIIGFANIMKRKTEEPRDLRNLETIETSGQSLTTLVSSILDLSRIEAGDLKLDMASTRLQSILESTVSRHEREASAKGIELALQTDAHIPTFVEADEGRLYQVLHHLVSNAIKFTNEGSVTVGADCLAEADGTVDLNIWVADTGVGIPEHEREAIFRPFTQMDGQSIDDYGGTGIGLALARQLVEVMNGHIRVESKVGEGSRFEVVLKGVKVLPEPEIQEAVEDDPNFVLSEEARSKLPDLIKIIEEELLYAWTELLGGFAVSDIDIFSQRVQALGKEYSYSPLVVWGGLVQKQVEAFQLDALPNTLEQFPQLAEKIRSYVTE